MEERLRTSQSFRERLPIRPLREYVTSAWIQQMGPQSPPYLRRTIPNGSTELVCPVGSIPKLVGPQTRPTEELLAPRTVAVGVRFRPGAASAALPMPVSELLDLELAADELWGGVAVELGEGIGAAPSPQAALALLESALVKRILTEPAAPDRLALEMVRRLLVSPGDGVRSLATSLHISERQLRRRCERATGLTPKALQRMFRFQRFLALAGADQPQYGNLGRLAHDAGYADQSHLSREAARLAGRAPRSVLRDCRCSHDHRASYGLLLTSALKYARSPRNAAA
jgi:AraC-like DNA-binding protein